MTDTKESQINSRHVGNRRVIAPPPLPSETFPQKLEFNSTVNDGRIHLSGDSNSDTTLENASQMSSCCIQQRSLSPSVSSSSLNTATGASLSLNSETNPPIVQIPEPINDRKPEDNSWSRPSHRRNLPEIIINQKIDISSWDFQEKCLNAPIIILRGFLAHPSVILPQNASFEFSTIKQMYGDQNVNVLTQKIDESGWNSDNFHWEQMALHNYLEYYNCFRHMTDVMKYLYIESNVVPSKLDDALEELALDLSAKLGKSDSILCHGDSSVDTTHIEPWGGDSSEQKAAENSSDIESDYQHSSSRLPLEEDSNLCRSKSHIIRLVLSLTRVKSLRVAEAPKQQDISPDKCDASSQISNDRIQSNLVGIYLESNEWIPTETSVYWSDVDSGTFLKVNKARVGSSALKERYAVLNQMGYDRNKDSAPSLDAKDAFPVSKTGSKLGSRLQTSFYDVEKLLALAPPLIDSRVNANVSESSNPLYDVREVARSTRWLDVNGSMTESRSGDNSQELSMKLILVDPHSNELSSSVATRGVGYMQVYFMGCSLYFYPVYILLPHSSEQRDTSMYFSEGIAAFANTFVQSGLLQAEITLLTRSHWQFIFQLNLDIKNRIDSSISDASAGLLSLESSSRLTCDPDHLSKRKRSSSVQSISIDEDLPTFSKKSASTINLDEIFKHGQIRFCSNLDIGSWSCHRKALKNHFPPWMMCGSQSDVLKRLRQDVDGMTIPQVYIKVPGVWTGGHEENCRMSSVNCNHGPGSSEWFGVHVKHVAKLRDEVLRMHKIDILHTEGRWYPRPEWLKQMKIPFMHGVQGPGDVIVLQGQTVHWVRSLGFSIHSSWNFGIFNRRQLESSLDRRSINCILSRNGFPTQSFIPMSTLILDLSQELMQFVYNFCGFLEDEKTSLRNGAQCSPYVFTREKLLILKNLFPNYAAVSKALHIFSKKSSKKHVDMQASAVLPHESGNSELIQVVDRQIHDQPQILQQNLEQDQKSILSYLKKDSDFRQLFAFLDKELMLRVIVELTVNIKELFSRLRDVVEVSGLLPEIENSNSVVVHCDNKNCRQEIFEAYILCPNCGYLCLTCASHNRCASSQAGIQNIECVISHSKEQPIDSPCVLSLQDGDVDSTTRSIIIQNSGTNHRYGTNKSPRKAEVDCGSQHSLKSSDSTRCLISSSSSPSSSSSSSNGKGMSETGGLVLVPHREGAKLLCKTAPWVLKRILVELVTITTTYFVDLSPLVNTAINRINLQVRKNASIRTADFARRAILENRCYPATPAPSPVSAINSSDSGKLVQPSTGENISTSSAGCNTANTFRQNIVLEAYLKLRDQTRPSKPAFAQRDDLWARRFKAATDYISDLKEQFHEQMKLKQLEGSSQNLDDLNLSANLSNLPSHLETKNSGSSYFKQFLNGYSVIYIPYEQKINYFDGSDYVSFDLGAWLHRIQNAIWTLDEAIDKIDVFYITLGTDLFAALFPCLKGYVPDERLVSQNVHLSSLLKLKPTKVDNGGAFVIDIERALQSSASSTELGSARTVISDYVAPTDSQTLASSLYINAPRKRKYSQGNIALTVDVNLPPVDNLNVQQMMVNPFIDDSISPKNFVINPDVNYILCENPDLDFISTGSLTQGGCSDGFEGNFFDDKYKSLCGKELVPVLSTASSASSASSATQNKYLNTSRVGNYVISNNTSSNPLGYRASIFSAQDNRSHEQQSQQAEIHAPFKKLEALGNTGSDPSLTLSSDAPTEMSSDFSLDSDGNLYVRPTIPSPCQELAMQQAHLGPQELAPQVITVENEASHLTVAMHIRNALVSLEAAQDLLNHDSQHAESINQSSSNVAVLLAARTLLHNFKCI